MEWTLEELVDRATRALADVRVGNGRVTEVPDGRLIRWYATRGLVDRPLPGPGRSARYGPRHLWQLVAIKRLQAQGHRLVEIQQRLTGATDATLRDIAGVTDPASGRRFWVAPVGHTVDASDSVVPADTVTPACAVERVVRLGPVTVRLPFTGEPTGEDLAAITQAAQPLLRALTELATTAGETAERTEGARG